MADIQFIENVDDDNNDNNIKEELFMDDISPPRPPKSIHIGGLSINEVNEFWNDDLNKNDIFNSSNLPSLDSNGKIYIMNYLFLPYEQMISIFLLTSEYLDPNHGLHSWPTRKRNDVPNLYKNIRSTIYKQYKQVQPSFACVFKVDKSKNNDDDDDDIEGKIENANIWISKVDFVPNNTTRDRYVNYGTEILRCNVPMKDMNKYYNNKNSPFYDEDYQFEFLLTQKWTKLVPDNNNNNNDDIEVEVDGEGEEEKEEGEEKKSDDDGELVHVSLTFKMGMRSGIHLYGNDDSFMYNKANQNRYLTLCMPPINEPLAFISEHVAHYISNIGIWNSFL